MSVVHESRIINSSNPHYETFDELTKNLSEFVIDAWYWLVNYVQTSPENKAIVILAVCGAILPILFMIKRVRFL